MTDQSVMGGIDLRLWGKSRHLAVPYPLAWHLVDTAAVAGELWDRYLTPAQQDLIISGVDDPAAEGAVGGRVGPLMPSVR